MKTGLIVIVSAFSLLQNLHGQTSKFNSSCDAINFFINSPKVTKNFIKESQNDSLIYFVDLTHALDSCNISNWKGKKVSIINEGPIFDSLKHFNLYYVTAGRTNIYLFYKSKTSFMIQCGRNNVLSLVDFEIKKSKYYLRRIENGVE